MRLPFLFLGLLPALMLAQAPTKGLGTFGFVENNGQVLDQEMRPNPVALYLLAGGQYNVQLRRTGFSYDFFEVPEAAQASLGELDGTEGRSLDPVPVPFHRIDFELLGCNTSAPIEPKDKAGHRINYFTAGTPKGGVTDVRQFGRVIYREVYPGIDLEFLVDRTHGFKYNFLVHANGDLNAIRLAISGGDFLRADEQGLHFATRFGEFVEQVPECHWRAANESGSVQGRLVEREPGVFGFEVDALPSATEELVIDPVPDLLWCTYYGAHCGVGGYAAIDVDPNNKDWVFCGATSYTYGFATANAYQGTIVGYVDAFLGLFDQADSLHWCTYYGGDGVDGLGTLQFYPGIIVAAGLTNSSSEFATNDSIHPYGGNGDGYLARFDRATGYLQASTYFGGAENDQFNQIARIGPGLFAACGTTSSPTGIASTGAHQSIIGSTTEDDAFLCVFDTAFNRVWSTYYGGAENEFGYGVVHSDGALYMLGSTRSLGAIATPGAYLPTFLPGDSSQSFVTKFDLLGNRIWGSYYGGVGGYGAVTIATQGPFVCFAGYADALWPTTPNAYQTMIEPAGADWNGVIVVADTSSALITSTFTGRYRPLRIEVTPDGIFTAGNVGNIPGWTTPGALDTTAGGSDGGLAKYDFNAVPQWATRFGGGSEDILMRLVVLADTIYTSGSSFTNGLSTPGAWQDSLIDVSARLLARFKDCEQPPPAYTAPILGPDTICPFGTASFTTATVPGALAYSWSMPPGALLLSPQGSTSATVQFGAQGGTISVRARNACATAPEETHVVVVDTSLQVTVTASGPIELCPGGSVVLNASGATLYDWSDGSSGDTLLVDQAGSYYAVAESGAGCVDTSNVVEVVVVPLPSVSITPAGTLQLCDGDSLPLTATGTASAFEWSTGDTTSTIMVDQAGSYYLIGFDPIGCSDTSSTTTVVSIPVPLPAVTGNSTPIELSLETYSTPSVAGVTYNWSAGGGSITGGQLTPSVSVQWDVAGVGFVSVEETAPSTCTGSDTLYVAIVVDNGIPEVIGSALTISPVPATDELVVNMSGMLFDRWEIVDVRGTLVMGARTDPSSAIDIPVGGLAEGLYQLRVSGSGRWLAARFVVMR